MVEKTKRRSFCIRHGVAVTWTAAAIAGAALMMMAPAASAHAQLFGTEKVTPDNPHPSAARLEFKTTHFDFGRVPDTHDVTTYFDFTNTGKDMLIISEMHSTCGCTVPELAIRDYLPGESGRITVKFDPRERPGKIHRVVTVKSNDGANPEQHLDIDVDVYKVVDALPPALNVGDLIVHEGGSNEATLTCDRKTFKIGDIDISGPYVSAQVLSNAQVKQKDGSMQWQAKVQFTVDKAAPKGWLDRQVVIHTVVSNEDNTGEIQHEVKYNVNAHIGGRVEVRPERVTFGTPVEGSEVHREMLLYSRVHEPFKIVSVRIVSPTATDLTVKADTVEVNGTTIPRVSIDGKAPKQMGAFMGSVFIKTDVPGEDELEVKFFGSVRPAPSRPLLEPTNGSEGNIPPATTAPITKPGH